MQLTFASFELVHTHLLDVMGRYHLSSFERQRGIVNATINNDMEDYLSDSSVWSRISGDSSVEPLKHRCLQLPSFSINVTILDLSGACTQTHKEEWPNKSFDLIVMMKLTMMSCLTRARSQTKT